MVKILPQLPTHRYSLVSFVFFIWGASCGVSMAQSLNAPAAQWGVGLSAYQLHVQDPKGSVNSARGINGLNIYYRQVVRRDVAYVLEGSMFETSASTGAGKISQSVHVAGMRLHLERKLRLSRTLKPWLGAGLGVFQQTFTDRRLADSDGFYQQSYPDRQRDALVLSVSLAHQWPISKHMRSGLSAMIETDAGDGVDRFSLTAQLWY